MARIEEELSVWAKKLPQKYPKAFLLYSIV